ncbi:MAG TPA: alpha/beta fold hydrolase [Candidatus Acidoferrales bacterium]|nr:alpha/beta fold hydrolase [Candidatus Acidoferrales bacterium]
MKWKPRLRVIRLLQLLAIAYLLVVLAALIFQRRLIYFPSRIPADVIETVAKEHGFSPWRNPSGQIIGWRIPARGTADGSVLIVHGNAGCALGRDYLAQPIHEAAKVDVFVLEYPGYGARPGSPAKGSILAAAEEAYQLLPAGLPKYIVSESIGAGVACELAGNHPSQVAGLALFVPYANLSEVAQRQMPFLPAYILLFDRFNPAACLHGYHGPVQFVIAGADEILGPATGKKLFEGYGGPKRLTVIPGAGHNDVAAQSADWWKSVFSFWRSGRE